MHKPDWCKEHCPLGRRSSGFTHDSRTESPKLALVLPHPSKDDIIVAPWLNKAGWAWEQQFLRPFGLTRRDVLISYLMRCYPQQGKFPTGKDKAALNACRHWDERLLAYAPTVWGITYNPTKIFQAPQQTIFFLRAVERAIEWHRQGHRPVLLCGDEVKDYYCPWADGGLKRWQGHWWQEVKAA